MSIWKHWLITLVIIGLSFVAIPIHFNADVFSLLPEGAPTVDGLKRYQQSFGASEAVILAIESEDASQLDELLPTLAKAIEDAGLATDAIWQSPFGDNRDAMAELLAYLWMNQPKAAVESLRDRLQPSAVEAHLQSVLERIATSFNAGEVARLANDPLQLSQVSNDLQRSKHNNPFASQDGRLRVMYLAYPGKESHYWAYRTWLESIDNTLQALRSDGVIPPSVKIGKTGNPVFVVEFGSQLLRDLSLAAIGTLLVVMLLFWWAHRQWNALLWLSAGLAVTLALTILIGAALYGALNAVSLGFAALLMGLAVDYGLIVYQEYRSHPERSPRELRRHLAPSILWAAVTTAGAFLMLTRSSLPGLTQLGMLVSIGILVAALVVLYLFLPSIAHTSKHQQAFKPQNRAHILPIRPALALTFTGLLAATAIVLIEPPAIQTDVAKLQFNENQAQQVHNRIQQALSDEKAELWLIFSGDSASDIATALEETDELMKREAETLPIKASMPLSLWPQAVQADNLKILSSIAQESETLRAQVLAAGFTADSLALNSAIFDTWERFEKNRETQAVLWPQHPSSQWVFSQFASQDEGRWYALGKLELESELNKQQLQSLVTAIKQVRGVQLVGWSILAEELAGTMTNDVLKVLIPMLAALLILLAAAFRHPVDILLSFFSLAFSLLLLSAGMSLLGWQWNIMNLTALPLLLGAGVDYSIHIQLALKRYEGDLQQVFRSVGRAILLCGASTTAAFASLGLGSNAGIASLGKVAALGIAVTALIAVFLLPQWWRLLRRPTTPKT